MSGYRQKCNDDSSDDEGPIKRSRPDFDDDDDVGDGRVKNTAVNSRNVWTDVAIEESLSVKGSVMDIMDKKDTLMKINRGAETYSIPSNAVFDETPASEEKLVPVCTSDDPFGDSVDLGEVEAFGVSSIPRRPSSIERGRGRGRGEGGRGRGEGRPPTGVRMKKGTNDDEMDTGEKEGKSDGNRGGRGMWRGGMRGRGRYERGSGGGWKRQWQPGNGMKTEEFVTNQYSLASLMATEFPQGLTLNELGSHISDALGEKSKENIIKIVNAIGETKSLELFEETRQAESAGGLMIANGSRRRTPGGVFILFFKSNTDVDPSIKEKIFEETKQQQRKIAKGKRRGQKTTDYGEGLEGLEKLIEKEKKKDDEMEDGEATPSPSTGTSHQTTGEEQLDYEDDDEDKMQ